MTEEIIVAGFGGQGVLSLGMLLAYGGMLEGKEVSWMPSYGPEMRGGTANCIIITSDEPVSSPIVSRFDSALVFNQPSLDKFEPAVKPDGLLMYEKGAIIKLPTRRNIRIVAVPAAAAAVELKNQKVINMIMLGAFLALKPVISLATAVKALYQVLPERHHPLIPLNEKALRKGRSLVVEPQQE